MKKIIAVMAALMFAAVLFNINVSAMSESSYSRQYVELLGEYKNGNISYDDFKTSVSNLSTDYVTEHTHTVTQAITGNLEDLIAEYGESFIKEVIGESMGDYATTESVPTTDLKGYSCLKIEESIASTGAIMRTCTYFNGYVEVSDRSDGYKFYKTYFDDGTCYRMEYKNGRLLEEKLLTDRPNTGTASSATRTIWVYGDVRNTDGTPAETDDTYVDQPTYDFSEATDNELDELLQDLSEELKRQNPDLSTMEGLLESIYYRLGKLDSDDDNALLSQINAAIVALAKDGTSQNMELINKLDELKEALGGGEASDLTEITDELKDISKKLGHLCNIEVADNVLELTEDEQKLFDEWANLIPLLVDKVGLAVVTQTMHDIETVIFTTSAPSDLTFTLFDETYVLLSTETFSDENVMLSVNNIKTFISVILVYVWCIRMRRLLI